MEVNYVEKGEPGQTCADCKHFQDEGSAKGKCFAHEVSAAGHCNFFDAR